MTPAFLPPRVTQWCVHCRRHQTVTLLTRLQYINVFSSNHTIYSTISGCACMNGRWWVGLNIFYSNEKDWVWHKAGGCPGQMMNCQNASYSVYSVWSNAYVCVKSRSVLHLWWYVGLCAWMNYLQYAFGCTVTITNKKYIFKLYIHIQAEPLVLIISLTAIHLKQYWISTKCF